MFNRLLKVSTDNGEQRWINLDRVTRISKAIDNTGETILVFCFDGQDRVTVHGTDHDTRTLIQRIATSLDSVAQLPGMRRAA